MEHAFREIRQPSLTFYEKRALFAIMGSTAPWWFHPPWKTVAEAVLLRLSEPGGVQLHFIGELQESSQYWLTGSHGQLPIARLGSRAVLYLLEQGWINPLGDITDAGFAHIDQIRSEASTAD